MSINYLDQKIRKIPNFPKKGILFYDVTTLFENKEAFRWLVDKLCRTYEGERVDKIVGIDARGFLLASVMAYKLGAGVSIIRKKGKLPHKTIEASYEKEYGPDIIEMHQDTIKQGEKILIVDDLLATGGTMLAAIDLVERVGGDIVGIDIIVNLSFLPGFKKVQDRGYTARYLVDYNNENIV